jgi:subtilase family serine protease
MRTSRTWVLVLASALCVSSCTAVATPPSPPSRSSAAAPPTVTPIPGHIAALTPLLDRIEKHFTDVRGASPGPEDIADYGIGSLWRKGIDGTGTTIALVEGWNDPLINDAVQRFDQQYGLPDPDIQTIYPTTGGHLPARCPAGMVKLGLYGSCSAWAPELELDVEAVHAIAPYAKILLVVAPADSEITGDAASQVAPPEMMQAVEYVSEHHLADVISISDDTGESTYSYHQPEITAQDPGELAAAAAGIPLVVGTGDCGVVQNLAVATSQCGNTSTKPDTAAWDDSPWVTAVGGSTPELNPSTGGHLGPDRVWQEGRAAEGAGFSSVYTRPDFQNGVAAATGSAMRSVPDITMDAQSGTSESTPLFAAVLALAAQLNHGSVGAVNDALYRVLGPQGRQAGITDIVTGSNSVPKARGFAAHAGFDVATGWGTIDASRFVPALVSAVRAQHGQNSPSQQAAAALDRLRHAAHVAGGTNLTATGFLPKHPVRLAIDGRAVAAVTASTVGAVSYRISSALPPGRHTVTLDSMLLTETTTFTSP